MGGMSDGIRPPKSLNAVIRGRLRTSASTSASWALCRVSFSNSSPARRSSASRFSVRISQASVWATSMSLRTSSSISRATSWL